MNSPQCTHFLIIRGLSISFWNWLNGKFFFLDEPITLHRYNKVAYDLRETAEVICKVKAYPRPEFQWSYSTNTAPLLAGADGHYEINTTVNESGGDIYTSVLQISNVRQADYGEYNCRVANTLGSVKTQIRLQPKGAPERPEQLTAIDVGHRWVTKSILIWNYCKRKF